MHCESNEGVILFRVSNYTYVCHHLVISASKWCLSNGPVAQHLGLLFCALLFVMAFENRAPKFAAVYFNEILEGKYFASRCALNANLLLYISTRYRANISHLGVRRNFKNVFLGSLRMSLHISTSFVILLLSVMILLFYKTLNVEVTSVIHHCVPLV
jgi:hypothetical protein